MARTRGASSMGDGVVLGRGGEVISPRPHWASPLALNPHGVSEPVTRGAAFVEPDDVPAPRWRCDTSLVHRSLEAVDLMKIIEMAYGPIELEVDQEGYNELDPNVKQSFRKIR